MPERMSAREIQDLATDVIAERPKKRLRRDDMDEVYESDVKSMQIHRENDGFVLRVNLRRKDGEAPPAPPKKESIPAE